MKEKILLDTGPSPRGWHRISTFGRCPRLFYYKYVAKLALPTTEPLVRGTLIHLALAHHYSIMREKQQKGNPGLYYEPIAAMEIVAPRWGRMGLDLLDLCVAAYQAYVATYGMMENIRILYVEEIVEGGFGRAGGPRHRFTQRYDLVFQDPTNGRVIIVDHKTAAHADGNTVTRYSMSGQFHAMQHGGPKLFKANYGGAMLNIVGVGKDPKMKRQMIEPAPEAVALFPIVVADREERIAALEGKDESDYPPAVDDLICVHSYGRCEAMELCKWGQAAARASGIIR